MYAKNGNSRKDDGDKFADHSIGQDTAQKNRPRRYPQNAGGKPVLVLSIVPQMADNRG